VDWVLWSGAVGLQRPVPERLAAAAAAGCSFISISPLDVQVAATEGTGDDLGRSVRADGLATCERTPKTGSCQATAPST